jgi:hypothetical protein
MINDLNYCFFEFTKRNNKWNQVLDTKGTYQLTISVLAYTASIGAIPKKATTWTKRETKIT